MSSNLRAEPVNRQKLELGTSLKFALRKCFSEPLNVVIGPNSIKLLEGMIAAGNEETVKDAEKLIDFINKHGDVLVKEEY